jgi:hypothetical protein
LPPTGNNTTQPGGDPNPSPPPSVTPPPAPPPPTGTPSGYRFTGYNEQRARDPNRSAKDALYEIIQGLAAQGIAMPNTKAEAEAFALQYLVPGFARYGYDVDNVQGDSFRIDTRENNDEIIDWLVNAGSQNPDEIAVGWQSSAGGSSGANSNLVDPVTQLRGMPGGISILEALLGGDGLSSGDLYQRIQEELRKLLMGQAPSNPNAPLPGGWMPPVEPGRPVL